MNPSSAAARLGSRELRWSSPRRGGIVHGVDARAGGLATELVQLDHGDLATRADVEHAALLAERGHGRTCHVSDVDVVPRLRAFSEDPRLLAVGEGAEEDRDDSGLAVRVLPRAVDVSVAQADVRRPVEPVVHPEVLLCGELRGSVRGQRRERGVLAGGLRALAVDRASGRAEDDLRAVATSRLEHPDRADHVRLGVVDGAVDRDPDIRLRGEVEHRLGPHLVEELVERLADVLHVEHGPVGHVLALPGCQRVDDGDLVAAGDERVHDVGSDESGPACHHRSHGQHPMGGPRVCPPD